MGEGGPAVQRAEEAGAAREGLRLPQGNPQDQGHRPQGGGPVHMPR